MSDFGMPVVRQQADSARIDCGLVLVVSQTPVNRIVVARIAERCGMRSEALEPSQAGEFLSRIVPAAIILDGGGDNRDCDGLVDELSFRLEILDGAAPAVIFLSTASDLPEGLPAASLADAVVAKPITPEALQPTIHRLTEAIRAAV